MDIIPDEFLEKRTCDVCYKFLTVAPLKVYPNRKAKCGRCSNANDDGNIVPPLTGAVKCVNRFDGCRELLRISDVVSHEKTCISQAYSCPLCRSPWNIPTYMMVKHFKDYHEFNLLTKSSIRVEMIRPKRRIFLHRIKDNLFFVECNNMNTETLELHTFFLGKRSEKVTCRFSVYFGDDVSKIETIPRQCTDYGKPVVTICKFRAPSGSPQYAFVQFHIDTKAIEMHFAIQSLKMFQTEISLPRTICLIDANISRLSVGSGRTSLMMEEQRLPGKSPAKKIKLDSTEFIMFCITCSGTVKVNMASFIETSPLTFHIICEGCKVYFLFTTPDYVVLNQLDIFPEANKANFAYSCVWKGRGCEEYLVEDILEVHEVFCPRQLPTRCPSLGCFFIGTLFELDKHFMGMHIEERFTLRKCSTVVNGETDCGICHMWSYYGFISIKVAPYGDDFYVISIVRRRILENFGQPKPELVVLDLECYNVTLVTVSKPMIMKAGTCAQIWSFFNED